MHEFLELFIDTGKHLYMDFEGKYGGVISLSFSTEQEVDDFNLRLQTCICDTHSAYWLEHCYDLFFEILYNRKYYKYYVDDTRRSDLDRIAYIKCARLITERIRPQPLERVNLERDAEDLNILGLTRFYNYDFPVHPGLTLYLA